MVTAIILFTIARGRVNDVAERLAALPGVAEVYSVAGRYDLAAIVRVPKNEDLADLVTRHMVGMDGIGATETLISFRAFSRKDVEAGFALGGEGNR
ncbi:MAG TPA: Lrp/AsnC ligand binding domain-containing protein [Gemmatimonadales bacterium]|nr:Lrp/AsnC ligand binding domain-containing protein [Gemmatimonadales bacterium]